MLPYSSTAPGAQVTSRINEPFAVVSTSATTPGILVTGQIVNSTSGQATVNFNGLPVPTGGTAQIIIGGVRINALSATGNVIPVTAQLAVSNGPLPLQNSVYTVGLIENGLSVSVTPGAVTAAACTSTPGTLAIPTGAAVVNITEGFATAFKQQNPSAPTNPDSETGPYPYLTVPNSTDPVQQASSGTQFAVTFANIPSGLTYYVPVTITSFVAGSSPAVAAGGIAELVSGSGSVTINTGAAVTGLVGNYVAVTANSTVYYNVVSAQSSVQEAYIFTVYPSGAFSGAPSVSVSLAPVTTGTLPPTTIPQFIQGTGGGGLTTNGTSLCQTSLLFPFVTNQAGFDTGMSIAYTGVDPFGTVTTTQGGATPVCTLNFYNGSTTPPAAYALTPVPAGGENHTTISAVAPGFQGYIIAVCNFTYAHGYAFITDGFMGPGKGLSEGYVANVIGNSRGANTGLTTDTPSSGVGITVTPESLGH